MSFSGNYHGIEKFVMRDKMIVWVVALLSLTSLPAMAEIRSYPVSGGLNLRIPAAPPVPGGAKGKMVPLETLTFTYRLIPHLPQGESGSVFFQLRDEPRRGGKTALTLSDGGNNTVAVTTGAAQSAGRQIQLTINGGRSLDSGEFLQPGLWRRVQLKWQSGKVELNVDGINRVSLAMATGFHAETLSCRISMIDELALSQGGGDFCLDWEDGYAGHIRPAGKGGLTARLFGFDTMVIGTDQSKRDCPAMQLVNTTARPEKFILSYQISSEINHIEQKWQEEIKVPAGRELMHFIQFPFALNSDIYHFEARIDAPGIDVREKHHFMYVERRREKPGPGLFGLHDCNVNRFGFWPDALPIRYSHKYLRWGWVQGPAFAKGWDGHPELDPAAPTEEWNWNATLDWELMSGRDMFVCLESFPYSDWYRERAYATGMKIYPSGMGGGFPRLDRYAQFIQAAARRYRGKVRCWEVENEPNVTLAPKHPEDYAAVCATVYKNLKDIDPSAFIYGISGTSGFVPWMQKALQAGAAANIDGVSWHTYTTPLQPDRAGLYDLLAKAKKSIPAEKKKLFNSETGVLQVMRVTAEQPIPPALVAEKINDRAPGFVSRGSWPGKVNDEWQAASSMIRNAVTNFVSGARGFIFFGWNPDWPANPAQWQQRNPSFSLLSATLDGERTPSLLTLAVGVLTVQLEGVNLELPLQRINTGSAEGAIFSCAGGGEVAVLWSISPSGTALLRAPCRELETISAFGQKNSVKAVSATKDDQGIFLLPLGEMPVFVHLPGGKLHVLPSPIDQVRVKDLTGNAGSITFTLLNGFGQEWDMKMAPVAGNGYTVRPDENTAKLHPRQRKKIQFTCSADAAGGLGEYWVPFRITLPSGTGFDYSVKMRRSPVVKIGRLGSAVTEPDPATMAEVCSGLELDRPEQAVVGRPPKLASLQEDYFWGGRDELSATVWLASNDTHIFAVAKVHDRNPLPPKNWPGVQGSSLELFFDFRPGDQGRGQAEYGKGVYQFLICPALNQDMNVLVHSRQLADPAQSGIRVFGRSLGPHDYWVGISLPRKFIDAPGKAPEAFGFDIGVNGPFPDKNERKTQLMLFGTARNYCDASSFGLALPYETSTNE
jgi:hypothetical protein